MKIVELVGMKFTNLTVVRKISGSRGGSKLWECLCDCGKFISRAYYLDRMDNKIGYSKENCVVCCTRCNRSRGDYFTYDEWYGMTEYFRKECGS